MKKASILGICLIVYLYTQSQNRPEIDIHGFFDMGWVVGPSHQNGKLDYLISVDYNPGLRMLKRIWDKGDLAIELSYHNVHFHLHQYDEKLLPNNTLHDRERFYVHVANLGIAHRYYFSTSMYVDFGINLDWNFRKVHMIKNPDVNGDDVKTFDRTIDYFQPFNYDVFARIGKAKWTIHYVHRLSPLIKTSSRLPGLPPQILGIGLRM